MTPSIKDSAVVGDVPLPELPDQYESAVHIFPCDLEDLQTGEKTHEVFSLPVGSPTHGKSVPLWTSEQMQAYGRAAARMAREVPIEWSEA